MRGAAFLLVLLLLAGCPAVPKKEVKVGEMFVGGSQGLAITYSPETRLNVSDGGIDPFDVVVQLENLGEATVPAGKAKVTLTGILPSLFGKTEAELTKAVGEELPGKKRTPEGVIITSPPIFVEFLGLNYLGKIVGATQDFPLRASVCYSYKTNSVSNLCVRENILAPAPGGICEIVGPRTSAHSGAPIGVIAFEEFARGANKIGFTFTIKHLANGSVFEADSGCEALKKKDYVVVTVDTGMPGLSCTGLTEAVGNARKGKVRLVGGTKLISCSQDIPAPSDYIFPVTVKVEYDYEDWVTAKLTVKSFES